MSPHASIVSKIAHEVFEHQPSAMPRGQWWRWLPSNFHRFPESFELGRREQLQIGAAAAFDVGLRTAVSSMIVATSLTRAVNVPEVLRDFEEASVYAQLLDAGKGRDFYPMPPRDIVFHERKPRGPFFRPKAGRCVDLSWESQFSPYHPSVRERYLSHAENLVARARYWRHDGPARPTLVVLHGFVADAHPFNERFFQLRWFYEKLGLDVVCFTLPFHGPRRGRGSHYTGQKFLSEGVCWTAEAMRQTVLDFRALLDWLRHERGAPGVGVSGISLGGYTTALLASVEPRLAFAIPSVPLVSMPDAVLEWNPVGLLTRAVMFAGNVSLRDVRHKMAIHSPLSYEPVLPKDRLFIIGGVGDRLASPKHARLLWDHWERPSIHWFPGNHVIHLDRGAYLRYMAKFLARIGFLPGTEGATRFATAA